MASPTWWTWVWASYGGWWWTGKPGVLQSMGSQRVGHDWATEMNWAELKFHLPNIPSCSQGSEYALLSPSLNTCCSLSGWNTLPHALQGIYTQTHTTAFITFWHKHLILIHWAQRPFLPGSPPPPPIIICAALRKDSDAGKIEGRRRGRQKMK